MTASLHGLVTAVMVLSLCECAPQPPRLSRPGVWYFPVAGRNIALAAPAQIPTPTPTATPTPTLEPPLYGVVDMDGQCSTLNLIGARWAYQYNTMQNVCPGIEMIPMIQSELNISQTLGGNSDYILGFNEPDMKCRTCWAHQAASTASGYWHQIEEMYPDKLLVAPVPISGPQYDPLGWLHDFRREYIIAYGRPPRFDAIAIHVYFYYANDVIPIIQQAEQLSIEWNVPDGVWITELGMPSGDLGGQWSLLLDWLDTQGGHQPGKVARVAPFGSSIKVAEGIEQGWYSPYWVDMSLVKDGILTDIGQDYLEHR